MQRVQVKASAWRGITSQLARSGLLEPVRDRLPAATRELVDAPPPSSNWVDFERYEELALAVVALGGSATWRRMLHRVTIDSVYPLARTAIEGFLRIFGLSPATLLERFDTVARMASRGVEYRYQPEGESAGVLEVRYPAHRLVNIVHFHGSAGGLEAILELCGVEGVVGEPEMVDDGIGNRARLRLRWSRGAPRADHA
jgi:hypothetical protein